jgi:hypothetical protein
VQTSDDGSSGTGSNLIALMDVPAKVSFFIMAMNLRRA